MMCSWGASQASVGSQESPAHGDGSGAGQTGDRLTPMALRVVDTPKSTLVPRGKLGTLVAQAPSCICLAGSGFLVFRYSFLSFHPILAWSIFALLCVIGNGQSPNEYFLGFFFFIICFFCFLMFSFTNSPPQK